MQRQTCLLSHLQRQFYSCIPQTCLVSKAAAILLVLISTGVRFGSTPPNLFELHHSASKHIVRVFYRCSTGVRFGSTPPNLFELHHSTSKHFVRVFYRCSVWFYPSKPLPTTPQRTLCEGVLQVFGVVRPLRTSSNYNTAQANTS